MADGWIPQVVLVLSGKRKSGKDYLASKLLTKFGEEIANLIHLSAPLKSEYSKAHSLDFDRLLDSDGYKEKYRADMIKWGEEKRRENPFYFCKLATENSAENSFAKRKKIWIICDARRTTDLDYFQSFPQVVTIRIEADEETRRRRGFEFVNGVDDAESECGLDQIATWHFTFDNSDGRDFDAELNRLIEFIDEKADTVGDANVP